MNTQPPSETPRSDEQLLLAALAPSCETDSHEYWDLVRALQNRASESLLKRLRLLIASDEVRERVLAADVLAQSRMREKKFCKQCVQILLDAVEHENTPPALVAICSALGHHKAPNAVGILFKLQNHPNADVRLAVVQGLSCQDDPMAISALISLSADSDRDIRNWATFGLGSMTEVDSDPLRDALLARVTEDDEEISGEAMVGLAIRGDSRVATPLLKAINAIDNNRSEFGLLIIEAVEAVRKAVMKSPNEAWQPILVRCNEIGLGKPNV